MAEISFELSLPDTAATETLGRSLADALVASGGAAAVLYLRGELGAGKTTCVRRLLQSLGVRETIRSPTYTLVETYELPALTCVHVDLYRLHGSVAVEALGLRDYLDMRCLLLVEWPERGGTALPRADVELTLSYHIPGRRGFLASCSALGGSWLHECAMDTSLSAYVSNIT